MPNLNWIARGMERHCSEFMAAAPWPGMIWDNGWRPGDAAGHGPARSSSSTWQTELTLHMILGYDEKLSFRLYTSG